MRDEDFERLYAAEAPGLFSFLAYRTGDRALAQDLLGDAFEKVLLATGWLVAYGYLSEIFMAWYSGDRFEIYLVLNRMMGPYAPLYWALLLCNVAVPQILWWRKARRNVALLFVVSLVVNMGMWMERFLIVVSSLHRDFLPSSWGMYSPTLMDWAIFIGTIGLFLTLLLLFIRVLPMISMAEMRELVQETKEGEHAAG